MRKLLLASVVVLVALASATRPSVAQPSTAAPAPAAPPPAKPAPVPIASFGPPSDATAPVAAPRPEPVAGARRDEGAAVALSLLGTIVPWTMIIMGPDLDDDGLVMKMGLIGTFFGPNLGHWYQGVPFTRGTALRLVGGVAGAYGFMRAAFCEESCRDSDVYIFLGGALLYLGASIDDIIDAPRRARKHNKSLELGLAPVVTHRSAGLAIGGSF